MECSYATDRPFLILSRLSQLAGFATRDGAPDGHRGQKVYRQFGALLLLSASAADSSRKNGAFWRRVEKVGLVTGAVTDAIIFSSSPRALPQPTDPVNPEASCGIARLGSTASILLW
jgi:hypothetical protein